MGASGRALVDSSPLINRTLSGPFDREQPRPGRPVISFSRAHHQHRQKCAKSNLELAKQARRDKATLEANPNGCDDCATWAQIEYKVPRPRAGAIKFNANQQGSHAAGVGAYHFISQSFYLPFYITRLSTSHHKRYTCDNMLQFRPDSFAHMRRSRRHSPSWLVKICPIESSGGCLRNYGHAQLEDRPSIKWSRMF